MKITRRGSAAWQGGLAGKGAISVESGALIAHPYGFASRFEGKKGTNPEELLGAAHAGCFTMALAKILQDSGFTAESIETAARVTLEESGGTFAITTVALALAARIPGIDDALFQRLATQAKLGCAVSKALKADITLAAQLLPAVGSADAGSTP